MANLPELSTYEAGIYQLETTDPCLAGPSGVLNTPLKQLANRTKYLKDVTDALNSGQGDLEDDIIAEAAARSAADALINNEIRFVRETLIAETGGPQTIDYTTGRGTIFRCSPNAAGESYFILPLAANCPAGTAIAFKQEGNSATNLVVINRSGSNTIIYRGSALTQLVMHIGDMCILVSNGTNRWNVLTYHEANVGLITNFGMSSLPAGYLHCNGAAISRTTYGRLFAVMGTTFGAGDGSTTFNLPDLRGEFVRGWDDVRGVDSGRAFGSAQADALKSHSHLNESVSGPTGKTDTLSAGSGIYVGTGSSVQTGTTGGTETRPRNVALIYGVKY